MELSRSPLQFYIDQPVCWRELGRCVIIRGWCFGAGGKSIQAVRLRTLDRVLGGVIGLPRMDVRTVIPDAPDDNTGFEIRGTLPSGRVSFIIEAQLGDGTWHQLMSQTAKVKWQGLPRWLGGGTVTDLIAFQMPAHMAYPARPVRPEKFPVAIAGPHQVKFSIVTPSYNQARFLGETMRSVLEQDSVDCAYVVQDGGSTDGSQRLVAAAVDGDRRTVDGGRSTVDGGRRTEDGRRKTVDELCSLTPPGAPRLVAWESAPDAGQADAIKRGFAKTSGGPDDVMAWINSDDFYLPGALAYVVDYFAQHPDVDVIYGHRIVVDEESREIARWFLPKHDPEVLRLNDFVPQETMFWRRRIWEKVGGIDASFKFAMDWDLLLRFQAAGAKIVRVPYFLACFRVHAAQKTSAQMQSIGQLEINHLRERTQGRVIAPEELEKNSRLLRYLRRSAFIEWLWKLGIRLP